MSTRRARIKAVAALPPRRRNAENADTNKNKGNPSNDNIEKVLKSPKTPRTNSAKTDEKNSPAVETTTLTSPPGLLPISSKPQNAIGQTSSPVNVRTPIRNAKVNTPTSGKISVITSASNFKNTPSVFMSPLAKSSPERRAVFSPIIPKSPRIKVSKKPQSPLIEKLASHISSKEHNAHNSCKIETEIVTGAPKDTEKKNDIPDDYNVPSVPESITDDPMDGIVPLQSLRTAPRPIDLLKNEIISENAEVLFDPIVPLPSPSKVRPKLRPVPRLAPYRRNSIQGSASESEDESRRALLGGTQTPTPARQRNDSLASYSTHHSAPKMDANRIRNDSVCSTISQATVQPPPATSPVKEKQNSKARRQEMSKRMWRRRRETVQRDSLTMYDLIFYNPTTNPIVPDQDEMQAKEANAKEAERNAKTQESEEDADDPPASDAAPVPQIKLGPNGEIILDEKSLVIKQSDANRKVSSVVREGTWAGSGGGRYTRAARTADWSEAETVRFYRALAAIGTDFTLMAPLFPKRTRRDLKLKFKKEERLNGAQVDKALRSATSWDAARLQTEFKEEREDAARRAEEETKKLLAKKKAEKERMKIFKEMRMRQSRGSKAIESTSHLVSDSGTADDFIRRSIENKHNMTGKRKKKSIMQTIPDKPNPNIIETPRHPQLATLTLSSKVTETAENKCVNDMATLSRLDPNALPTVLSLNDISMPSNIETGSLVVLRVNDPSSPSKTMLQTYIARGDGRLTPVALPSMLLNSVVGYMKKGSPSTMSTASSPQLTSPGSVASQDSRPCSTPSVIQLNPSPNKRQRHSSYTVTPL